MTIHNRILEIVEKSKKIKCENCGTTFHSLIKKDFCSDSCEKTFKNNLYKNKCKYCGFIWKGKRRQDFCCINCKDTYEKNTITLKVFEDVFQQVNESSPYFKGHIYAFMEEGEDDYAFIKIGKTASKVTTRKSSCQTGNPRKLVTFYAKAIVTDLNNAEKKIHNAFENNRIRGEWFRFEKSQLIFLIDKMEELL